VLSDVGQRGGEEVDIDRVDGVPVLDDFAEGGGCVWDSETGSKSAYPGITLVHELQGKK